MSDAITVFENDYKTRYGIVCAALDRKDRAIHAYRALVLSIHTDIIVAMINEKSEERQRALFSLLIDIEKRVAAIDDKPLRLKTKL